MANLNTEQNQAVLHRDTPLLIIAGAGTGKTTVITNRIAKLIKDGADPRSIVALSFTEKAALEMEQRVDLLLNKSADLFAGTFHGFCQMLLENHGLDIGLPSPFKIISPSQSWQLFKKNLDEFNLDYYRPYQNPTSLIAALITHFSRCKDELILPEQYLTYAQELRGGTDIVEYRRALSEQDEEILEYARIDEVANAYHTFEQIKLKENALDFGDLLAYVNLLLEKRPNITAALQKQYQHILIDEFQDTNWAQYQLIKKLAGPQTQITVVADDDQSIYKWRGASVANVLAFSQDYENTKTVVLKENYRSGQAILDAAYTLIGHNNPDRLEIQNNIDKKLHANKEALGSVLHIHSHTNAQEVTTVVNKIKQLLKDGEEPQNIAILARANSHLQPFLACLRSSNIPCHHGAAKGLLKTKVALDCIAILRAIANRTDHNAWFRLLQMPPFALSHEDEGILWSSGERKGKPLLFILEKVANGVINISQDGHHKIKTLLHLIKKSATDSKQKNSGGILLQFLEESGYLKLLSQKEQQGDPQAVEDLLNLKAFFDFIEKEDTTPKELVTHIEDMLESGDQGGSPSDSENLSFAVSLLTVHSCKGLEFDHVFVVNMVEQRFPSRGRKDKIEIPEALIKEKIPEGDHRIQEERRLFYVALTRARKSVTLTSARNYGGASERKVSRFVKECEAKSEETPIPEIASAPEKAAAQKIHLPIPKTFSHSQLKSYADCPLKYKFAHVLGIRSKQSAAMVFGNTIHSVLQRFYERVIELNSSKQANLFAATEPKQEGIAVPSLQELLEIYKELWRDDWYIDDTQRAAYFEEGKNMLQLFYNQQEKAGWTVPKLLERGFKLRVGSHTVRGFIDRVDKKDGRVTIIDYKTGKPRQKLSPEDRQQLLLYKIAAASMPELKDGQQVSLTYYYLKDGSQQSFEGTFEDEEAYKEKILTLIARIQDQDFKASPNPIACGYCEFKDICEFRA